MLLKKFSAYDSGGLSASPIGTVAAHTNAGLTDIYAGVQFNANGTEYSCTTTGTFSEDQGAWLESGTAAEYWVQFVLTTGTFNSTDPGTARLQLNTTRTCRIVDTTTTGGAVTCEFTANFYDAASGGNLVGTANYALSALKTL